MLTYTMSEMCSEAFCIKGSTPDYDAFSHHCALVLAEILAGFTIKNVNTVSLIKF